MNRLLSFLKRPTISRRVIMIVLILSCVFTIAIAIRAFPAKYGFYLNEFDPYYDYYAANHIVVLAQKHGLYYALFNNPPDCPPSALSPCHSEQGYFYWHDITTWFPEGRDVAKTSQDGLQIAGAVLYLVFRNILGTQITLYDFLVWLPVFLGAFTAILFYFLVRKIAGDAAGLFSSLMIAVSPPLIERGNLGWFKSEPLAIFLFVCASYLFLTLFYSNTKKEVSLLKATLAGFLVGYANTSWGGALYFSVAFGLIFVLLPFIELDLSKLTMPLLFFTTTSVLSSTMFPRPGIGFVTNPAGLILIGGTLFTLLAQWTKTWVKSAEYKPTLIKYLIIFALIGITIVSFGLIGGLSRRYLTAIAPWVRSGNPLIESVAEHFVPTGVDYFTAYLIMLFLGVMGAVIALRRRNIFVLYALIMGVTGLYVSAAFSRLLVYSSIALTLLASIGFAELIFAIVKPSTIPLAKKKTGYTTKAEARVIYSVALIALIALPAGNYWIPNPNSCGPLNTLFCNQSPADTGVSLVNGATVFSRSQLNDWIQALQWVRENTPKDAVIISWWDYGYWLTVMGNRTTVADNATLNSTRIAQIGRMFMSNITTAARIAKQLANGHPAYVLLFIVGSIVPINNQQYYILQVPSGGGFTAGGGDESKKQWFIRIGGLNESQYLQCVTAKGNCQSVDDFNLTPYALDSTLFGKMLPFKFAGYIVGQNQGVTISQQYQFSSNGAPPIQAFGYPHNFNFPQDSAGPFRIAYYSPSLVNPSPCATFVTGQTAYCFYSVLIYQVI